MKDSQKTKAQLIEELNALRSKISEYERNAGQNQADTSSEKHLRLIQSILDSIPVPIFYRDKEGSFQVCNKAFENFLAKARQGRISKKVSRIAPPEIAGLFEMPDVPGSGTYEISFEAGGAEHDFLIHKETFTAKDGRETGMVGTVLDLTELRKLEKALEESKQKFEMNVRQMRIMADSVPDLFWAKDIEDRFLFVNKAMCEKLLMCDTWEQAIGRDHLYFAKRELDAGYEHTFGDTCVDSDEMIKKTGMPARFLETGLIRNKYLALDVHKAPFKNEAGEIIGTIGCGRDVTREREIEEALKLSEERYRQLFESVLDSIVLIDTDTGEFIDVNASALRLYGYTRSEFLRLKINDVSAEPELSEKVIRDVLAGEEIKVPLSYHKKKNGEVFPVELFAGLFVQRNRNVLCGVIRDITERREAERALRESEERFRAIFESAQECIFIKDHSLKYTLVNSAMENIFGSPSSTLIGKSDYDLFDLETGKEIEDEDRRALAGESISSERALTVNNEQRIFDTTKAPLLDSSGKVTGLCGITRDITERKHAEQAVMESKEQLRFLSSKLLLVLEEERKRIARELHDSIGQSLVAVKFSLESAIQARDTKRRDSMIKSMEMTVRMIQQTIQEVRRIYTGLRPSILDNLGIVATIDWFCREYRETYPGIHVKTLISLEKAEIPKPLDTVIFRIIQEALNNIAKHSKAQHVNISLLKVGESIELVVEDDGVGFDLNEAVSRSAHGRGLGLTGMMERAELSGGTLTIKPTIGCGTIIRASWSKPPTQSPVKR